MILPHFHSTEPREIVNISGSRTDIHMRFLLLKYTYKILVIHLIFFVHRIIISENIEKKTLGGGGGGGPPPRVCGGGGGG